MKKATLILGLVFSAVFLWLAVKDTDFHQVRLAFSNANLLTGIPLLAALVSFYWLKAIRWSDLLSSTIKVRAHALIPSLMTGAAGRVHMRTRERKVRLAVIVFGLRPLGLLMTVAAALPQIAPMLIVLTMTAKTRCRRFTERLIGCVTILTLGLSVTVQERKIRYVVIKRFALGICEVQPLNPDFPSGHVGAVGIFT